MIVLIDAEAGKVIVCDKQTREYSINDINSIAAAISGKEVYYVTSADMASGDEVVGLLSQITGKFPNPSEITTIQPTDEGEFLHPSKNRQIIIIGTDGREFQFRGIFDFKRLSSVPPEVMESEQMQMFLQSGVIEKVDAQRKKEIVSEFEVRTSRSNFELRIRSSDCECEMQTSNSSSSFDFEFELRMRVPTSSSSSN